MVLMHVQGPSTKPERLEKTKETKMKVEHKKREKKKKKRKTQPRKERRKSIIEVR